MSRSKLKVELPPQRFGVGSRTRTIVDGRNAWALSVRAPRGDTPSPQFLSGGRPVDTSGAPERSVHDVGSGSLG